jgi:hypothetical protein
MLCYLAKTTGPSIYIFFTDILFLTEMQKRQPREKGFALIENDITTIFYRYDTCVLLQ